MRNVEKVEDSHVISKSNFDSRKSGFNFKTPEAFLNNIQSKRNSNIDVNKYKVGQIIFHKKFGEGVIVALEPENDDIKVDIDFKDDSKIDEAALADVASRVGIDYVHSPDKSAIESHARSVLDKASTLAESRNLKDTYRYIIWPFALLLGGLLAWEGATLALRAQQLRNSHAI